MLPVLRNPRPADWKIRHCRWMSGAYLGLIAAAATELVVRTIPLSTKGQAWIAAAALALRVAIVAETRSPGVDRFAQDAGEGLMQSPDLIGREGGGGTRRVDAGPPQAFVRVDVSHSGDGLLVHQHLLDGLA